MHGVKGKGAGQRDARAAAGVVIPAAVGRVIYDVLELRYQS
jgi:hypothetical protein